MAIFDKNLGIIGGGNMGEAISGALIRSKIYDSRQILISDVDQERLGQLEKEYRVRVTQDNFECFDQARVLILAIKPQQMEKVLAQITDHSDYGAVDKKLIISIVAGVTLGKIEKLLYEKLPEKSRENMPVVRVMPNTPALVLSGMSGMSPNRFATQKEIEATRKILEAMGKVIRFEEKHLDAVTAMSGSGPAYVFYLIESMIAAGIELGLDSDDARQLTLETVKGAVKLMEEKKESAETLRKKVTSPGGTTEAALKVLEKKGVKKAFIEAIAAAARRGKDLSG